MVRNNDMFQELTAEESARARALYSAESLPAVAVDHDLARKGWVVITDGPDGATTAVARRSHGAL